MSAPNFAINLRDSDCPPYTVENQFYGTKIPVKQQETAATQLKHGSSKKGSMKTLVAAAIFAILVLIIGVTAVSAYFAFEIAALQSDISVHEQALNNFSNRLQNATKPDIEASGPIASRQDLDLIFARLENITQSYSSRIQRLEDTGRASFQELGEDIDALESLLCNALEGHCENFPATSCAALPPNYPSDYYWVRASNGSSVHVYCDMTRSCGGITGGWTRVAQLDMTSDGHQCPTGLIERNYTNTSNLCVSGLALSGCSSTLFPTSINYTSVCGRTIAHQINTPDAFESLTPGDDIDSIYVDGVSLTHGNPREHIWTFAAAVDENFSRGLSHSCPCIRSDIQHTTSFVPPFVGEDYFCDTANPARFAFPGIFTDDPLWDGAGCGPLNVCCGFNTPPWFYKQLPQSTSDDIEMRLCRDQGAGDEDIAVEIVDIYIR